MGTLELSAVDCGVWCRCSGWGGVWLQCSRVTIVAVRFMQCAFDVRRCCGLPGNGCAEPAVKAAMGGCVLGGTARLQLHFGLTCPRHPGVVLRMFLLTSFPCTQNMMMMMPMYFQLGAQTTILFESWKTKDRGGKFFFFFKMSHPTSNRFPDFLTFMLCLRHFSCLARVRRSLPGSVYFGLYVRGGAAVARQT